MSADGIDYYNKNSNKLCSIYDSLKIENVYSDVIDIFKCCADQDVLDVGCGSGRDIKYLAVKGNRCVGVDASPVMLQHARTLCKNENVTWVTDTLPDLKHTKEKVGNRKFNLVLCNAVFMHLQPNEYLPALSTLYSFVEKDGACLITIKRGPYEPERGMFEYSVLEFCDAYDKVGFSCVFQTESKDAQLRKGVSWDRFILIKRNKKV